MNNDYELRKNRILNKLHKLKNIMEDESIPFYKRHQAAAKYLEIEKRYFPKVIHSSADGIYKKS